MVQHNLTNLNNLNNLNSTAKNTHKNKTRDNMFIYNFIYNQLTG